MGEKEVSSYAFPLRNGNYKATGNWYSFIVVDSSKDVLKEPFNAYMQATIKLGDFGEADPDVVRIAGKKFYDIQITYSFGQDVIENGILYEDGMKITTKGVMGVCELE